MDGSNQNGTERPPDGDPVRREAERVFVAWCMAQPAGKAGRFEDLVAAHPPLAGLLVELRRTWDELGSLVSPGQFEGLRELALGDRPVEVPPPPGVARAEELLAGLAGDAAGAARYVVGHTVAHGGMGTILSARDRRLRREVALKRLAADGGPDDAQTARARFLAEAFVTARLDHPGIVPVHDLGLDAQGRVFFTMKLVDGITFREALERVARGADGWTLNRAVGVLARVCEAVAYAHSKGVLHRDIKPANVMVGAFGETYLMDWGLARVLPGAGELADAAPPDDLAPLSSADLQALAAASPPPQQPALTDSWLLTRDGKILGTPVYMSPEQACGEVDRVDERSDIWSLGAILYHLLTGRLPWVPDGDPLLPLQVLLLVRHQALRPARELAPDAPPTLLAICERALAVRPEDRYRGANEMAAALRDYLEDISEAREEARRQETRARNLLDFLLGVLASGDPAEARGRDVTVREVVDRAAERLDRRPPAALDGAHLRALLGRLYKELGRFDESAGHLELAVGQLEGILGPHHPDTLSTATDLALVWRRTGRTDAAESLLHATLDAQRDSLGELHQDTLRSEHLLAALLHRTRGETDEAEVLYRRALRGRRIALGERHPDTLSTQAGLASVLAARGQIDEAVTLYEDAVEGLRQVEGEDHPAVLIARSDLAQLYARRDGPHDLDQAEAQYRVVLATQERVVSPEHPDTLTARNNLGMVLLRLGRLDAALSELRAAAEGHARALGEDNPRTLAFRANVALALLESGRLDETEAALRDVLERAAASRAVDPTHVARFHGNLGRCLRRLGRLDEAEAELLAALEVLEPRLGAGHPWTREARAELSALRGARG